MRLGSFESVARRWRSQPPKRVGNRWWTRTLVEIDRAAEGVEGCVEVLKAEGGRVIPMGLNAASAGRLACTQLVR